MAEYRFELDLTRDNVKEMLRDLDLLKRGWNKKAGKVLRLTGQDLVDFIWGEYYATDHAGSFDVYVWMDEWAHENGVTITAEGNDIYFLEFGTGQYAETSVPFGYYVDVPIGPGSYSQTVGAGNYTEDHPYWWYNHQKIEGTLGALAFDKARQMARDKIEEYIVEVFG